MHTQIVVVALGTAGAVLATFENARGVAPTKGDRSQAEVSLCSERRGASVTRRRD
jgi:hypothetical protein